MSAISPIKGNTDDSGAPESQKPAAPAVSASRKPLWGRFLDFYALAEKKHPYLTGVATASSVYLVGDTVAQWIMPGKSIDYSVGHVGAMVGMSLYYGWESPHIFRVIDRTFPLGDEDDPVHRPAQAMHEGALYMSGKRGIRRIMERMGSAIARAGSGMRRFLSRKRRKLTRAAAYRIGIAPFWTMRHMGVLGLIHGSSATPAQMAYDAVSVWATWLPLLFAEEYVVQNKIPLRYRFLATSAVCCTWQISASLVALLHC